MSRELSVYEKAVQAMVAELPHEGPMDKGDLASLLDAALDVLGPEIDKYVTKATWLELTAGCRGVEIVTPTFEETLAALKESR